MAFHGDLSSFPLPELLQWLGASHKTGALQLGWDEDERTLFLEAGQVSASASPGLWERIVRILQLSGLEKGDVVLRAFTEMRQTGSAEVAFASRGLDLATVAELAQEDLYGAASDLTLSKIGRFSWSEDVDRSGEEWVPVQVDLRHLVAESIRWIDEQPEVERILPDDSIRVRAKGDADSSLPVVQRILLALCGEGQTLGMLRLSMTLSRDVVEAVGARGVCSPPGDAKDSDSR